MVTIEVTEIQLEEGKTVTRRLDNDRDGFVDCDDSDCLVNNHCARIIPLTPPRQQEDNIEACSDRIDNDG